MSSATIAINVYLVDPIASFVLAIRTAFLVIVLGVTTVRLVILLNIQLDNVYPSPATPVPTAGPTPALSLAAASELAVLVNQAPSPCSRPSSTEAAPTEKR